jgi:endonuclease/exonuclease/phosphatase family metal-dependent hydrolase
MPDEPRRLVRLAAVGLMTLTALAGGACATVALDEGGASVRPAPWAESGRGVRWMVTGAPADAPELAAWRAAVGEAVVRSSPATPPDGVPPLVVVSWNLHVGGGDLIAFVGDLRAGAFTDGRPVERFVLLLQEVHRTGVRPSGAARAPRRIESHPPDGPRLDVVEVADRLGLDLVYAPSMGNGRADPGHTFEDRGNAILASLSLTDPVAIELPYEGQRRVAVGARVEFSGDDGRPRGLRLVSAHLDNRTRWARALDSFGPSRTRQARALAAALHDREVVLGADLNTWAPGMFEGAPELLERAFPDAPELSDATFRWAGLVGRKLDHLLMRFERPSEMSIQVVDARYGSDHHPVLAVIEG